MRWENGRPGTWYGYTDLSPMLMPTPAHLVLTDRDTGTLWQIRYVTSPTPADGYGYITISDDAIPAKAEKKFVFGVGDEPYIDNTQGILTRLIVRGGYLGAEEMDQGVAIRAVSGMRLYARLGGLNLPHREIMYSNTGGFYAWVPYNWTPNLIAP